MSKPSTRARREGRAASSSNVHYRDAFAGMTAKERHELMMNDFMRFYGGAEQLKQAGGWEAHNAARIASQVQRSDVDLLREGHRFIRTEEDDKQGGLAARLARKYYERLFKEYCIADLSRYKESKLGLRWRTEPEVVSGKGQFSCGAKGCNVTDELASFEVNFAYQEAGQQKQALVKLRLCPNCSLKLNYKKEKQFRQIQAKELRAAMQQASKKRQREHSSDRGEGEVGRSGRGRELGFQEGEDKEWVQPPTARQQAQVAGAASGGEGGEGAEGSQRAVLPADDRVWETKPVQESNLEEELDAYLESMFV